MTSDYPESLRGHFLIAMPGLLDPNFHQTVVCISEHTREGAVGLVINRVHAALQTATIFEELEMDHEPAMGNLPVHLGGPVHASELFILHGPPFDAGESLVITPALAMSTTRDVLQRIARGKGPPSCMIALGCAGWGPGQLEAEIKQNAWLTCDIAETILFATPVEKRWEATLAHLGIDPALLMDAAGHA
jgi:putative transcriptional regulator